MKKKCIITLVCGFFWCLCLAQGQSPLHTTFGKSKSNFQKFIVTNKIAEIQEDMQTESFPMTSKSYRFDTSGNMVTFGESGQNWGIETTYTYDKNNNLTTELRKEIRQISNEQNKLTESESEILKIYEYENNQLVAVLNTTTGEKTNIQYQYSGDTTICTATHSDITEIKKLLPQKEEVVTISALQQKTKWITKYDTVGNIINIEMIDLSEGDMPFVVAIDYEYDPNGNVLKKKEKIFNEFIKGDVRQITTYFYDLGKLEKIESIAHATLHQNHYFQYSYRK